jgi:hypothetical protein
MHIVRKKQRREKGGPMTYLLLRYGYQGDDGKLHERLLYFGAELAEDLEEKATRKLRVRGYTPAQIRVILEAVRARRDRSEYVPISVRGKPVAWRDPPA